ncbi:hypothetical protein NC653_035285 [Populus alba x Populus x berolinensis]|uniref:Uncharacterized protein n=1 Tax=Populus alba x Populus x berolinensis TaxID=444605 RepID=A0AAD6LPN6_9ROSI|nr:hypothetical protein NC653_035285 [Populus alba x Populus x berolinensis]
MKKNPMARSASITSHTMDDDLHVKLLYLKNRERNPAMVSSNTLLRYLHVNSTDLLAASYLVCSSSNRSFYALFILVS